MVKRRKRKAPEKTIILLNGRMVGTHPDGKSLAQRLRERRRMNELSSQVNVYYNARLNELHILTDKGRVRRPYIVVENGKPRLTPEILGRIKNNELNWNHLVKMGIIEYLDAQEEENSLVAFREDELTQDHTHLEVDAANMFGVVAGSLPYSEHNSSPRITMACAMTKQSLGVYSTNFNSRYDTRAYVMYYPQQPLVQTNIYRALNLKQKAAGQNCVVALTSYHGYNMADAIVVNRSAIDRGLHRVTMFKTYETEERMYPGGQKDKIELPTPEVVGFRGEPAYRHLAEDGIVMPESEVGGKDVLVGKTSPPRFLEEISVFGAVEEKKRESSLSLKSGEAGKVDSVMVTEGPSGNRLVKVRVRSIKTPEVG
ncbi:MAG: DNA-directed RNA polymerase subunit B, partial [Candidatus Micrarchaeota archaeon]